MTSDLLPDPLCALLGIRYPLLQAPMAGASGPDLVAAVSNAGGLGGFGAAGQSPEQLGATVAAIQALTDAPFNVNLFHQSTEDYDRSKTPDAALLAKLEAYQQEYDLGPVPQPVALFGPALQQLDVLLAAKVPVISFHFGIDRETVERIHAAGSVVLCSATNVAEALALQAAGVDAVIAQGAEAGGHRGTFMGDYQSALVGSIALVPRLVDALKVPVIAAGGIMDARGMVAAFALGALGVQMGTAFLGCRETALATQWDEALAQAEPEDTCVTRVLSGKPARGLRNRFVSEMEDSAVELLPYPAQYSLTRELRRVSTAAGSSEFMALWAGQGVGLYKNSSAAELIDELVTDCAALMRRMGGA